MPTQCIKVFQVTIAIYSDSSSIQHSKLVLIIEAHYVFTEIQTEVFLTTFAFP